jgi:hypothetical protein
MAMRGSLPAVSSARGGNLPFRGSIFGQVEWAYYRDVCSEIRIITGSGEYGGAARGKAGAQRVCDRMCSMQKTQLSIAYRLA